MHAQNVTGEPARNLLLPVKYKRKIDRRFIVSFLRCKSETPLEISKTPLHGIAFALATPSGGSIDNLEARNDQLQQSVGVSTICRPLLPLTTSVAGMLAA